MLKWEDAKKELDLRYDFELLKLFPIGLQPYSCKDEGIEEIGCPYEYHRYNIKFCECKREIHKLKCEKRAQFPDEKRIEDLEASVAKLEDQIREISRSNPNLQNGDHAPG